MKKTAKALLAIALTIVVVTGGIGTAVADSTTNSDGTVSYDAQTGICTAECSGLIVGEQYALFVIPQDTAISAISSENVAHADQQTAESDSISFQFIPRAGTEYSIYLGGVFQGGVPSPRLLGTVNIAAHTHTWSESGVVTTPATCTQAGVMTYTCTGCGETKTEPISALGHNLIHHEAKAPTYTEVGWNAYDTCSRCDYTTYVELPMLVAVPGDLNGDGEVDNKDVIHLMRWVVGGYSVTMDPASADFNGDGKTDNKDVVLLMRYIAGGYGVVLE